jgi:phenylacetate-CoA ligase
MTTMIERIASRIWWRRFLSRSGCSWAELETFPRLSPAEQQRDLSARLLAQIKYFGNRSDALPEWREAAQIENPADLWKVWPTLPIVDKQTLRARFPPHEIAERFGIEGSVKSTGGSTGEPTHVWHDTGMTLACNAASTYTRLRMGWQPGMATIILWGSERDVGKKASAKSRLYVRLLRDIVIDGYELNSGKVDLLLELIHKNRPVALQGFTSMLVFAARSVLERGKPLPEGDVHVAWNGGEMLFDEQSANFQRAFGVPILNRYGGRELSVMACQFGSGEDLQVLRPWLFLEVVDDAGKPVGPSEPGRLLWTSTICRGTPFLRYEIGDLGRFSASHHSQSGISQLSAIDGRSAGLLELPNGKTISCLYWNHLFKEFEEVQQFQVVVRHRGELDIRLQGGGMEPARQARLQQTVRTFIGDIAFQITWVERIPLTPRGKLVQVVRE